MSTESPAPLAPLQSEASRLSIALDAVALDRFARYLSLLEAWRERAGLTAISDPDVVQRRHFGESLALLAALRSHGYLSSGSAQRVVDIGSGAGFPGLPMCIAEPALRLTLLESHGRRARFLQAVVEELGLDGVTVVTARAEEAGRDPALREAFDLAVARALAPLAVLVEYALPLLRTGGLLAAPKGSRASDELREARAAIAALDGQAATPVALPLATDVPPQTVLLVRRVGPLDDRYPRRPGIPARRPLG